MPDPLDIIDSLLLETGHDPSAEFRLRDRSLDSARMRMAQTAAQRAATGQKVSNKQRIAEADATLGTTVAAGLPADAPVGEDRGFVGGGLDTLGGMGLRLGRGMAHMAADTLPGVVVKDEAMQTIEAALAQDNANAAAGGVGSDLGRLTAGALPYLGAAATGPVGSALLIGGMTGVQSYGDARSEMNMDPGAAAIRAGGQGALAGASMLVNPFTNRLGAPSMQMGREMARSAAAGAADAIPQSFVMDIGGGLVDVAQGKVRGDLAQEQRGIDAVTQIPENLPEMGLAGAAFNLIGAPARVRAAYTARINALAKQSDAFEIAKQGEAGEIASRQAFESDRLAKADARLKRVQARLDAQQAALDAKQAASAGEMAEGEILATSMSAKESADAAAVEALQIELAEAQAEYDLISEAAGNAALRPGYDARMQMTEADIAALAAGRPIRDTGSPVSPEAQQRLAMARGEQVVTPEETLAQRKHAFLAKREAQKATKPAMGELFPREAWTGVTPLQAEGIAAGERNAMRRRAEAEMERVAESRRADEADELARATMEAEDVRLESPVQRPAEPVLPEAPAKPGKVERPKVGKFEPSEKVSEIDTAIEQAETELAQLKDTSSRADIRSRVLADVLGADQVEVHSWVADVPRGITVHDKTGSRSGELSSDQISEYRTIMRSKIYERSARQTELTQNILKWRDERKRLEAAEKADYEARKRKVEETDEDALAEEQAKRDLAYEEAKARHAREVADLKARYDAELQEAATEKQRRAATIKRRDAMRTLIAKQRAEASAIREKPVKAAKPPPAVTGVPARITAPKDAGDLTGIIPKEPTHAPASAKPSPAPRAAGDVPLPEVRVSGAGAGVRAGERADAGPGAERREPAGPARVGDDIEIGATRADAEGTGEAPAGPSPEMVRLREEELREQQNLRDRDVAIAKAAEEITVANRRVRLAEAKLADLTRGEDDPSMVLPARADLAAARADRAAVKLEQAKKELEEAKAEEGRAQKKHDLLVEGRDLDRQIAEAKAKTAEARGVGADIDAQKARLDADYRAATEALDTALGKAKVAEADAAADAKRQAVELAGKAVKVAQERVKVAEAKLEDARNQTTGDEAATLAAKNEVKRATLDLEAARQKKVEADNLTREAKRAVAQAKLTAKQQEWADHAERLRESVEAGLKASMDPEGRLEIDAATSSARFIDRDGNTLAEVKMILEPRKVTADDFPAWVESMGGRDGILHWMATDSNGKEALRMLDGKRPASSDDIPRLLGPDDLVKFMEMEAPKAEYNSATGNIVIYNMAKIGDIEAMERGMHEGNHRTTHAVLLSVLRGKGMEAHLDTLIRATGVDPRPGKGGDLIAFLEKVQRLYAGWRPKYDPAAAKIKDIRDAALAERRKGSKIHAALSAIFEKLKGILRFMRLMGGKREMGMPLERVFRDMADGNLLPALREPVRGETGGKAFSTEAKGERGEKREVAFKRRRDGDGQPVTDIIVNGERVGTVFKDPDTKNWYSTERRADGTWPLIETYNLEELKYRIERSDEYDRLGGRYPRSAFSTDKTAETPSEPVIGKRGKEIGRQEKLFAEAPQGREPSLFEDAAPQRGYEAPMGGKAEIGRQTGLEELIDPEGFAREQGKRDEFLTTIDPIEKVTQRESLRNRVESDRIQGYDLLDRVMTRVGSPEAAEKRRLMGNLDGAVTNAESAKAVSDIVDFLNRQRTADPDMVTDRGTVLPREGDSWAEVERLRKGAKPSGMEDLPGGFKRARPVDHQMLEKADEMADRLRASEQVRPDTDEIQRLRRKARETQDPAARAAANKQADLIESRLKPGAKRERLYEQRGLGGRQLDFVQEMRQEEANRAEQAARELLTKPIDPAKAQQTTLFSTREDEGSTRRPLLPGEKDPNLSMGGISPENRAFLEQIMDRFAKPKDRLTGDKVDADTEKKITEAGGLGRAAKEIVAEAEAHRGNKSERAVEVQVLERRLNELLDRERAGGAFQGKEINKLVAAWLEMKGEVGATLAGFRDRFETPEQRVMAVRRAVWRPSAQQAAWFHRQRTRIASLKAKGDDASAAKAAQVYEKAMERFIEARKEQIERMKKWGLDITDGPSLEKLLGGDKASAFATLRDIGDIQMLADNNISVMDWIAANYRAHLLGDPLVTQTQQLLGNLFSAGEGVVRIAVMRPRALYAAMRGGAVAAAFENAVASFKLGKNAWVHKVEGEELGRSEDFARPEDLYSKLARRVSFDLMAAIDGGFQRFNAQLEAAQMLREQAIKAGKTGSEATAFTAEVLKSGMPNEIAVEAMFRSLPTTFQELSIKRPEGREESLDNLLNKVAGGMSAIDAGIGKWAGYMGVNQRDMVTGEGRPIPLSKFVLPFVRTPVAIARAAARRSFLGSASVLTTAAKLYHMKKSGAGEAETSWQTEQLKRRVFESVVVGTVAMHALAAMLDATGTQEDDKDASYTGRDKPSKTVNLFGTRVSYSRLEPFATPLAMAANGIKALREGRNPVTAELDAMLRLGADLAWFRIIAGTGQMVQDIKAGRAEDTAGKIVSSLAGGATSTAIAAAPVFGQAGLRNIAKPGEEFTRKAEEGVIPSIAYEFGGNRVPVRDLWGRQVRRGPSASDNPLQRVGERAMAGGLGRAPVYQPTEVDKWVQSKGYDIPGWSPEGADGKKLKGEDLDRFVAKAGPMLLEAMRRTMKARPDIDAKKLDNVVEQHKRAIGAKVRRELGIK